MAAYARAQAGIRQAARQRTFSPRGFSQLARLQVAVSCRGHLQKWVGIRGGQRSACCSVASALRCCRGRQALGLVRRARGWLALGARQLLVRPALHPLLLGVHQHLLGLLLRQLRQLLLHLLLLLRLGLQDCLLQGLLLRLLLVLEHRLAALADARALQQADVWGVPIPAAKEQMQPSWAPSGTPCTPSC